MIEFFTDNHCSKQLPICIYENGFLNKNNNEEEDKEQNIVFYFGGDIVDRGILLKEYKINKSGYP